MAKTFADERGLIEDLLGPVDAVTYIHTKYNAVRGNHIHHHTTQWVYILTGALRIKTADGEDRIHFPGELIEEKPGIAHAWQCTDKLGCEVLVFTKGPRSGEAYESDTERLEEKLIPCPPHA